jgi:hypothetical protein
MKKDYAKKGLVIGIIFLFIGVGVYPAIAVKLNTSSTNTIDKVENKDISINDISNFNLDRLNLLMFFSMKPKFFTSMIKSYSKISDNLCKLSSKDCLKIVDKMVKEKLSMTLETLKIIESKGLMDSSKTKSDYEDLYLKISEISDEYNEFSSDLETQDGPPIICLFLYTAAATLSSIIISLWDFYSSTSFYLLRWVAFFTMACLTPIFLGICELLRELCYNYTPFTVVS